jgi:hypothetical protein
MRRIQSTRPQTLAYALVDSPAGLLAWTTEWFDDYGDGVGRIGRELLLTNVMLYWLTGTAGSAARLYRENAQRWGETPERSAVPTGVAVFRGDGAIRRFAEPAHTVTRWTEYDAGGHFAAMQTPGCSSTTYGPSSGRCARWAEPAPAGTAVGEARLRCC